MPKRTKKQRNRDRKKRRKQKLLDGHEQVTTYDDTDLKLPVAPTMDPEFHGIDVGEIKDSYFEDNQPMLAAAAMGAFGPTAQRRAEAFAQQSKGHGVDIGGVPYAAMTESGHGPSFEERQQFRKEVMEPNPQMTISNYLSLTEHFRKATIDDRYVTSNGGDGDATQLIRKVWARLRQARIFDLPPYAYSQAHHLADRYTTEVLAGCPWHHPMSDNHPTKEEGERMATMYLAQQNQEFWFDHLPFETTYIGFGKGIPMSDLMMQTRRLSGTGGRQGDFSSGFLMGLLICDGGKNVYETIVGQNGDGSIATTIGRPCIDGRWVSPMTMMRWITPLLLDLINEYRTVVLEKKPSFSVRRDFKKSGKRQGKSMPVPKPYYVVNLKQKIIDERMRKSIGGMSRGKPNYGHRWDVRGHECVKIQRGTLPIDPKLEKKLRKAKYRIYTRYDQIPPADYHRMLERKHSLLKQGEWVAVLSWWRDAHVKGPPDAPYIPAVRRPSKNRKPTMH